MAYWLWCTPFEEDEPRSARAWQAMLVDATERRSARLLDVSGPVPWSAKGPVLTSLADDPRWHPAIWRAVHAAVHDVLGRVDPAPASALLSRLGRPPDGIDAAGLRQRLAPDRSRRRPVRRGRGRRSGRDGRR